METISTLKRDLEDAVEASNDIRMSEASSSRPYFWLDLSYDLNLNMSSYCFDDNKEKDQMDDQDYDDDECGVTRRRSRSRQNDRDRQLDVRGPRIDRRILPSARFGDTLAGYHWHENYLNLMFNDWNRSDMLFNFRDHSLTKLIPKDQSRGRDPTDRTSYLAAEYGHDMLETIMTNMKDNYNDHDDSFRSNKRTRSNDDSGGCSYNDHCKGPIGRDIGMPFTYPIAAALVYAIQGRTESVHEILKELDLFWDAYVETLFSQGKDESFICNAYRNGVGWCGWFLYLSFYRIEAYSNVLPTTGVCDEDQEIIIDSIGLLGLRFMSWGFGRYEEDLALEHFCRRIDDALRDEIDTLLAVDVVNRVHVERKQRRGNRWRVENGSLYCGPTPIRNASVVASRMSTAAAAASAAAMASGIWGSICEDGPENFDCDRSSTESNPPRRNKRFNCQLETFRESSSESGDRWIY